MLYIKLLECSCGLSKFASESSRNVRVTNNYNIMAAMFNLAFSIFKFICRTVFWIIAVVVSLLIGSCPD